MRLRFLAPEIVEGDRRRSIDVPLLALLGAAAKQDDKLLAVLAEINPVAGASAWRTLSLLAGGLYVSPGCALKLPAFLELGSTNNANRA